MARFLDRLFGREKQRSDDFEYFKLAGIDGWKEMRKEENKRSQSLTDCKMEHGLKMEAMDMFNQWMRSGGGHRPIVPYPHAGAILWVSDESTAKFKDSDAAQKFRNDYFYKLQEEAIAKVDISKLPDEKNQNCIFGGTYNMTGAEAAAFRRKMEKKTD